MSESEGVWWWEECRRKAPCVCVHEAVLDGPFQQSLEETDKLARGHEVGGSVMVRCSGEVVMLATAQMPLAYIM